MSTRFQPLSLTQPSTENAADFVVDQLIPHGYLAILAGEPKCGKTAFATSLALAIATGQPFLGQPTIQGAVLWLCLEESPDERTRLLSQIPQSVRELPPVGGIEPGHLPIYTVYSHPPIDTPEGLASLRDICDELQPSLVVIDSLHASHSGRSLCDGWAARRTLKGLKQFCGPGSPALLVIHHLGGTRYRPRVAESAQLATVASMFWILEETSSQNSDRRFVLKCRGRGAFANRFLHLQSASPLEYEIYAPKGLPQKQAPVRSPLDALILEALKENRKQTAADIASIIDHNIGSVRNAITRLVNQHDIYVSRIKSGTSHYSIVNSNTVALCHNNVDDFDDLDEGEPEEEEEDDGGW